MIVNSKDTLILVFSRDRAMQLDATLRSFILHCSDFNEYDIRILYTTSSEQHHRQYNLLLGEYSKYYNIKFIEEKNFKSDVLALTAPYENLLFLVDDNIFVRDFKMSALVDLLDKHQNAVGISLRLGQNTDYCYSMRSAQKLPQFNKIEYGYLSFDWTKEEYDFGYPLELSSSMYRVADIFKLMVVIDFHNPNTLEEYLWQNVSFYKEALPELIYYEKSLTFCVPCNKVQTTNPNNRASEQFGYSAEELADMFGNGKRIDIEKYLNFTPNACHQEVELYFTGETTKQTDVVVSVIIPCYKQAEYLAEAVESVVNQTYKKWEIIIVNDGSPDNTNEVANNLIKQYPNCKFQIIERQNGGLPYARNEGIIISKGKYILPLDADDKIAPDYLEETVAILESHPEYDIVYVDEQNFGETNHIHKKGPSELQYLMQYNVHDYCSLYRKSVWEGIGGYSVAMFIGAHDWNFWLTAAKHGFKSYHLEKPLFLYRNRAGTMVETTMSKIDEVLCHIIIHHKELYNDKAIAEAKEKIRRMSESSSDRLIKALKRHPANPLLHEFYLIWKPEEIEYVKVSVIIPTYNRPELLKIAILSVIQQTYSDYEIIVVNDCGKSVQNIIDEFDNKKIKYIEHSTNKGLAASRNTGIKCSRGKYLCYLDDDDIFYYNHLETLVRFLEKNNYKVAYTDAFRASQVLVQGEYVTVDRTVIYSEDFSYRKMLVGNYIPVLCIMHSRDCLKQSGLFDESLTTHEDWDLWIRIGLNFEFAHIKQATCEYTWRTDGSTMTSSHRSDMLRTLRIIYDKTKNIVGDSEDILNHRRINESSLENEINNLIESEKLIPAKPGITPDNTYVSIIIPVFNKIELTKKCIESIYKFAKNVNFEVIVIDNASSDGTQSYFREISSQIENLIYIRNTKNEGFAVACNQGINKSKSEFIVLLNNDTEVTEGWLESLVKEAMSDKSIGIVGSLLLYPGSDKIQHCGVRAGTLGGGIAPYHVNRLRRLSSTPSARNSRDYKAVTFACVLIKRELINEIGLLDEKFMNGYEDVDYCFRAYSTGFRIRYCAGSIVYHHESMTASRHDNDKINQKFLDEKWLNVIELDEIEEKTITSQWEIWIREILEKNPDDIKYIHRLIQILLKNGDYREAEELKEKIIGLLHNQEITNPVITFVIPFTYNLELLSELIKSLRNTVSGYSFNITLAGNIPKDVVDNQLPKMLSKTEDIFLLNDPMVNTNVISFAQGIISNNSCFICFIEPTLKLSDKWLEPLIDELRSDENTGIAGPCILNSSGQLINKGWINLKHQATGIDMDYPAEGKSMSELNGFGTKEVHALPLKCLLIRKSAVINTGIPDEGFEKYYADADFCLRMLQSGFKVKFCFNSIIYETRTVFDNTDIKSTKDYHRFRSKWSGQFKIDNNGKIDFEKKIPPLKSGDDKLQTMNDDKVQSRNDSQIAFSIIIPVHNNLDYTAKCIDGIRKTKGLYNIEIIIIDNASTDGTGNFLNNLIDEKHGSSTINFKIISNKNNENYAFVNNHGAEIANGKYLVFLNNDTYPFPGWLDAIEKEFQSSPDLGIQGAKLLYENGTIQHAGMIFGPRPGRPEEPYHAYLTANPSLPLVNRKRQVQFVTGACLAIRTELFRHVGGFDEEYVFGWEDTDLCMKVNTAGKKIIYNHEAVLYHYESGTKKLRYAQGDNLLDSDTPKEQRNRERFMSKWDNYIKRDADSFYAEDGLKMQGNTLVPISEEKFKEMIESQTKSINKKEEKKDYLTSFSKKFLDRNYKDAKTVIIKSPPAIGDAFALTALAAELKEKYPQLKIYISGNEVVGDVFLNHTGIEDIILSGSEEELAIESMADVVVDYTNIIAKLPEYYNGISYMDIFGNIAGMRFTKQDIIYTITEQEAEWSKNEISDFKNGYESVGIQLFTNKDQKRSYPYVKELINELLNRNPNLRFMLLGKESPGLNIPELYDCAWKNIPFRLQMALASHCDKFLTIDSAFYHAGHNYFKKPTMVLFGLTNPALSGNPQAGFAVVRNNNLNCLDCYWRIPCNIECMHHLTPSVIADEFMQIENKILTKFDYKEVTINVNTTTDIDSLLFGFYLNNKETVRLRLIDENNILPEYFENANGIDIKSKKVTEKIKDENISGFSFEMEEEEEKPVVEAKQIGVTKAITALEGLNGNPQLNIVWEGSQFVYHSLALINREQCANLIETGLANVTIVPYENDRFLTAGNPKYEMLKENDIRYKKEVSDEIAHLPYVWVRHQWPPSFEPPRGAKWIIMQPWEYTTLRKDFADLFKQADELWTPSTYSRQSFINSGVDFDKVQVIPNGIDPELFKPSGDKYILPTKKKLKFLYIGGTIFRKGIDILLHSYTKAFNSNDDVTLIIKDMGGESFYKGQTAKEHIEKLSRTTGSPEIIYYDEYMSEEQIANLYRACDVFVCSYRGEGFSLPTLEAMACGLPVIVTEGGSTDDFVDDEVGWLIPSQQRSIGNRIGNLELTGEAYVLEPDSEKLTQILINLYKNPALIFSKGLKASFRARTQWTWKRSTMKIFSRLDYLYGKRMAQSAENKLADIRDEFVILGEADEQFDAGEFDLAKQLYTEALDAGLTSEKYRLHVLHKLSMIGIIEAEYEIAGKYIMDAETIAPGHPDTLYLKAKIFQMNKQWTEMLEQLTMLMNIWKDVKYQTTLNVALDDLLCDTAEGLYELGDIENSLNLYTQALKMNNANPYACFGAARCFLAIDAKEDAKNMLEWAVKLKPDFAEAVDVLNSLSEL